MSLAYEVVGTVFALLNLMSAYGKLARTEQFVDIMPTIGVPLRALPYLAACKIAGAVGLGGQEDLITDIALDLAASKN
jgi:hypothetical protein